MAALEGLMAALWSSDEEEDLMWLTRVARGDAGWLNRGVKGLRAWW